MGAAQLTVTEKDNTLAKHDARSHVTAFRSYSCVKKDHIKFATSLLFLKFIDDLLWSVESQHGGTKDPKRVDCGRESGRMEVRLTFLLAHLWEASVLRRVQTHSLA